MPDKLELSIETLSAQKQIKDLQGSVNKLREGLSLLKNAVPNEFLTKIEQTTSLANQMTSSISFLGTSLSSLNNLSLSGFSTQAQEAATGVRSLAKAFESISAKEGFLSKVQTSSAGVDTIAKSLKSLEGVKMSGNFVTGLKALKDAVKGIAPFSKNITDLGVALSSIKDNKEAIYTLENNLTKLGKLGVQNKDTIKNVGELSSALKKLGDSFGAMSKIPKSAQSMYAVTVAMRLYLTEVYNVIKSNPTMVAEINKFADSVRALTPALNKASQAKRKMAKESENAFQKLNLFSGGWRSVITSLVGGSVIYTAVRWLRELSNSFIKLERSMRKVNTIARVGDTALSSMTKEVRAISSELGLNAVDVAEALYDINSATITGADAMLVLRASAKQAVAGYTDIKGSAELTSKIIMAYGMQASKADHITNVLFKTVERGINPMEALNKDFARILSAAKSAGISFEESAAALATLTTRGLQTNLAVTALNAAIMKLASGNKQLDTVFQRLGYDSAATALKMRGLLYTMKVLQAETQGSMDKIRALGFDIRDNRAVTILANEAYTGFAENLRYIADESTTAGATVRALSETQKTFYQTIKESTSSLINLLSAAIEGTSAVRAIKEGLTKLNIVLKKIDPKVITDLFEIYQRSPDGLIAAYYYLEKLWNLMRNKPNTEIVDTSFSDKESSWKKQLEEIRNLSKGTKEYEKALIELRKTGKELKDIAPTAGGFSGQDLNSYIKNVDATITALEEKFMEPIDSYKIEKLKNEIIDLQDKINKAELGTFGKTSQLINQQLSLLKEREAYLSAKRAVGSTVEDESDQKLLQNTIDRLKLEVELARERKAANTQLVAMQTNLRKVMDISNKTPLQAFKTNLESASQTLQDVLGKGLGEFGSIENWINKAFQMEKAGVFKTWILNQIQEIKDPAIKDQLVKAFSSILGQAPAMVFNQSDKGAAIEALKNYEMAVLTPGQKVLKLNKEILANEKKIQELRKKNTAVSRKEEFLLIQETGELRNQVSSLYSNLQKRSPRAAAISGVETGTQEAINVMVSALNMNDYAKDTADYSKVTAYNSKIQAKALQDLLSRVGGNSLVVTTN